MAKYHNRYFKHLPNMRNDPGIRLLEERGYQQAYRQWCIFLELAIQYDADLNEGKFKMNSRKLAQELRIKYVKLPKLKKDFSSVMGIHFKKVRGTFSEHSKKVPGRLLRCSGDIMQITIPNLLPIMGSMSRKSIYYSKDKEKKRKSNYQKGLEKFGKGKDEQK